MNRFSPRLVQRIAQGERVVVLTGAGLSVESGIPTFRGAGGLWENEPVEALATPEGFGRDPRRVWRFYDERRRRAAACVPNAAHRALAEYGGRHPGLLIVTQNIDGLHQGAGSRDVVELHGSLWRDRCDDCGAKSAARAAAGAAGGPDGEATARAAEGPPRCGCGGLLRPDIVWFGEPLPEEAMARASEAARRALLFLVIGTSAVVYPAARLPAVASAAGAWVVEINPQPTPLSGQVDEVIRGTAGSVLPPLLGAEGDDAGGGSGAR